MSASSGKSKFFGFLKNVFQKSGNGGGASAHVEAETEEPVSIHSAPPIESAPRPAAFPQRRKQNPYGNGHGAAATAAAPAASVAMLHVSLQAVINSLPLELRGKVVHPDVGDAKVAVPMDKVLSQLSQGVVKVPFGDIRESAPYAFTPEGDSDRIAVSLPLNEILLQLNPALLVRRPAQKSIEVPTDITSPFDGKGEGLVFSVGNNAKPVAPASPRHTAPAPATPARGSISSVPFPPPPAAAPTLPPAAPISMPKFPAASAPAAPMSPIAPKPSSLPPSPIAFNAPNSSAIPAEPFGAPPRPAPKAPSPAATPFQSPAQFQPPVQFQPAPQFQPPAQFQPPIQFQPAAPVQPARPVPPTPAHVEPAAPVSDTGSLTVALKALAESWPDTLRQEIVHTGLVESRVALPCDAIEPALKRGRAAFPWRTVRSWIRPPVPTHISVHDATEVELPLRVIAPLFLARQSAAAKAQPKQAIDETIPNLFFGFPKPEAGSAPTQATQAPQAPQATPLPKPSPVSSEGDLISVPHKPSDTNYYVWNETSDTTRGEEADTKKKPSAGTDFVARYATPNEIVSRAGALEGVAGALIALPDGLMVASRLSPEINGDTLAAFLPQIFAKVNQCTRELRMGELNNLNFTVGNIPWKIFRVNAIFFAAFGRVAEPLPTAALAALAAELDRKR